MMRGGGRSCLNAGKLEVAAVPDLPLANIVTCSDRPHPDTFAVVQTDGL